MRCVKCGWIVGDKVCPCGQSSPQEKRGMVSVGTRVAFRYGRGPNMQFWAAGAVVGHQGFLHQVETRNGSFWCEHDDLVPESVDRDTALMEGTRVWALWIDGRWYSGMIEGLQGRVFHVAWDDGDAMWLEPHQIVVLAAEAGVPTEGTFVLAKHWNGQVLPARVEQRDGARYRVVFRDGEESWVPRDDLTTFPPCPFNG